ncbi:hypothetical protein DITRI_Ditri09bG0115500 [Diplodiscus trichospermus]
MGSSNFLLFFYSVILSLATLNLSLDDANLNCIISQFSSLRVFNYGFFYRSTGKSTDIVYTSALCRGDLNQDRCNRCLNYTATELKQLCPSNKAATTWSEFCLVRYANRNFYGLLENNPRTCVYNINNASNPSQFNQVLTGLLNDLSSKAATGGPFRKYAAGNAATGNVETVYAMVQCTPDTDQRNCSTCLNFAISEYQKCCSGRLGCRVLRPTCILRFKSNYPFFNQTAVPPPPCPRNRNCHR